MFYNFEMHAMIRYYINMKTFHNYSFKLGNIFDLNNNYIYEE